MPANRSWSAIATALLTLGTVAATDVSAITVLTLGDSITKGEGSFASGGYRQYLDQRLSADFQFIGRRRDEDQGDHSDWQFHNGYPGYQAAVVQDSSRSILKRLQDDRILPRVGRPDVILLHVGTNSIGYADPVTPDENYAGSSSDRADTQLYRLLTYLGDIAPTTKIILANIIPKASSASNLGDTFRYNFGNPQGKGGIPAVLAKINSSISSRITLANMFQMNLNALGRSDLIGDHRVDPDSDGIVDWALNFDEYNYNSAAGMSGYNPYLYNNDGVHPSPLGYELMAAQWYRSMQLAGIVQNPSPTAVAAGLAMLFAGATRRRR